MLSWKIEDKVFGNKWKRVHFSSQMSKVKTITVMLGESGLYLL